MEKQPAFTSHILGSVVSILSQVPADLSDPETLALHGSRSSSSSSEYSTMSVCERNNLVAEMVRDCCLKQGYFAGWQLFANVASGVNLHSRMVADVVKCLAVYDTLRPAGDERAPTDLRMTITRAPSRDSIFRVAPKNVGGNAWIHSKEYSAAQEIWSTRAFAPMSPCTSFIWSSVQRKTISRDDRDTCDALTLLGTVDFDYDRMEEYKPGFAQATELGKICIRAMGTRMQGAALAALLNFDVQQYVRQVQEKWVVAGKGAGNFGPSATSPADWITMLVGDCGVLCAFGYEDFSVYNESKAGMFVALFMACIHDVLYDLMTSNQISTVMYLAGAGVAKYDVHTAFLITITDRIARRVRSLDEPAMYGDNSLLVTGAWAPFNERYRTWERFVKYTRQLRCSADANAKKY
ncbi:hypothetical protein C8J57DRAFT_598875 [Mycena rebaudengoi]|nr:hypothetical protein C8J57DRAFT_598875 [Mycena rebaudengoi]